MKTTKELVQALHQLQKDAEAIRYAQVSDNPSFNLKHTHEAGQFLIAISPLCTAAIQALRLTKVVPKVEDYDFVFTSDEANEKLNVTVLKDEKVVEIFSLKEGHPAINWPESRVKEYLVQQLQNKRGETHDADGTSGKERQ